MILDMWSKGEQLPQRCWEDLMRLGRSCNLFRRPLKIVWILGEVHDAYCIAADTWGLCRLVALSSLPTTIYHMCASVT